jgi:hypothetical protein
MCPNCIATTLVMAAGLFLTPWSAVIAAFKTFGRSHNVR